MVTARRGLDPSGGPRDRPRRYGNRLPEWSATTPNSRSTPPSSSSAPVWTRRNCSSSSGRGNSALKLIGAGMDTAELLLQFRKGRPFPAMDYGRCLPTPTSTSFRRAPSGLGHPADPLSYNARRNVRQENDAARENPLLFYALPLGRGVPR